MAISANEVKNAPLSEEIKRQLMTMRQATTMFNVLNLIPSECAWYISAEKMEEYVLKVAEEFLGKGEIKMVTIEAGLKGSRAPRTYIWMKKDSRHLVDKSKSGSNSNMVISPRVDRFSDDLRKFADQFAPTKREDGSDISRKKRIRLMENTKGDKTITAIPVDLTRILGRIFDEENRGFQDTYGSDVPARRCLIRGECKYTTKNDRTTLTAIKVTKYFEGVRDHSNNRPMVNFRYSDNDDRD